MYKRIFVPIDGSVYSKRALVEATKIAQLTDATIYLCTVVTTDVIVPPGSLLGLVKSVSKGQLQKRLLSVAKTNAEKLLKSYVKYCASKNVTAYYKIIVNGNIADEILRSAKSASLIVIGSQGLHGISRLKSLGSVSRKVSELAHCPVLIVR
ncbi:MAG: universal stress protein [Nitrososphaera sp.]|jgi:nucleotide-binding universal stress UspA family protein